MTAAETLAACKAEGIAVAFSPEGRLSYHPAPSLLVLDALRLHRDEILRSLRSAADADCSGDTVVDGYDPARDAVRIEYEQDGILVGVWLVPDRFTGATFDGEPSLRRCELGPLIDIGDGALRRALVVLRAFPGARVRRAAGSLGAGR